MALDSASVAVIQATVWVGIELVIISLAAELADVDVSDGLKPIKPSLAESGIFLSDDPRSLNSTRYDDIFDDLKATTSSSGVDSDVESRGKECSVSVL